MMVSGLILVTPTPPDQTSMTELAAEGINLVTEPDTTRLEPYQTQPLRAVVVNADGHLEDTPHLCEAIRPQFSGIPLLAVTAHYSEARLAALKAGADDLLTAPLDPAELRWRLKQAERLAEYTHWAGLSNILIHDLKSPLGTVVSSLEVLRELLEDEYGRNLIDNSLRAIRRQSELLDAGLDYILLRNRSYVPEFQPVSLRDVVSILKEHMSAALLMKEMMLECTLPDVLPPVRADYDLLVRVLKAILDTSIKFSLRKSIVTLTIHLEAPHAVLVMTDRGREILPDYEQTLFHIAHQWDARMAGSRSTVALNLPFARAALQLMEGTITAFSSSGLTTFRLTIPLA
ncbi:MAG: HAMP domain-containing histidine kinase [Anaerolineae bacterium]|nr:MAG: HAMP domain-containing histidine kinase [Anaerolineae bacterium]